MSVAVPEWAVEAFTYGGSGLVVLTALMYLVRHYNLAQMGAQRAGGHIMLGGGLACIGVMVGGLVCTVFKLPYMDMPGVTSVGGTLLGASLTVAGYFVLEWYPPKAEEKSGTTVVQK